MTWTTELPTAPGWYYRRAVSAAFAGLDAEIDIVSIFSRQYSHEPINLWLERFGEDGAETVRGSVMGLIGAEYQYEFQPVKPPED